MRRVLPILLLLLAVPPVPADEADEIVGLWITEGEDHARVEIRREGDEYRGRIVWLAEPEFPEGDTMAGRIKIDRNNPDPALRERPIVGLEILEGFRWAGGERWTGGKIYDPKNGKTYRCRIRLTEDGALRVRGFVGISLLGRTAVWTRFRSDPHDP
jgi:uncharacterized protein (DUF2147 family)